MNEENITQKIQRLKADADAIQKKRKPKINLMKFFTAGVKKK